MIEDFYAAAAGPKRRPQTQPIARRNRELLAERLRWPAAALEECLQLERDCPDFEVAWFPEWKVANPEFCRERGFYAWLAGDRPLHHGVKRREWFGATAAELKAKLAGG